MADNDLIYSILRKADVIIFDSNDAELKDFLSLYYKIIGPKDACCDGTVLYYSDSFSGRASGVKAGYFWYKEKIQVLGKMAQNTVSGADIKEEYIKRFLGSCSA